MMDAEIKFLSLPNAGDHAIVVVHGRFGRRALEMVFAKLETTVSQLLDCNILIDLQDAIYDLSPVQAYNFVNGLPPDSRLTATKIALLSKAKVQEFDQIFLLCAFLSHSGFPASVFRDVKSAVQWLA